MGISVKPYFELFRPITLVAPAAGGLLFPLWGLVERHAVLEEFWKIPLVMFILAMTNAAGNVINQVYDAGIDNINKPNRPIPSGRVSWQAANSIGVMIMGLAMVLAFVLKIEFGMILSVILLLAWTYSAPPRWKKSLLFGNLAIATPRGGLGVLAAYSSVANPFDVRVLVAATMFGVFVYGANITKDFGDEEGDRKYGIRNFVTVYGRKVAGRVITVFLFAPYAVVSLAIILRVLRSESWIVLVLIPLSVFMSRLIATGRYGSDNKRLWILFYMMFTMLLILYTAPFILFPS